MHKRYQPLLDMWHYLSAWISKEGKRRETLQSPLQIILNQRDEKWTKREHLNEIKNDFDRRKGNAETVPGQLLPWAKLCNSEITPILISTTA